MSFYCGSPKHEGERLVRDASFEKRVEYRRKQDYGREKVVKLYNICRPCIVRETESIVETVDIQERML